MARVTTCGGVWAVLESSCADPFTKIARPVDAEMAMVVAAVVMTFPTKVQRAGGVGGRALRAALHQRRTKCECGAGKESAGVSMGCIAAMMWTVALAVPIA